MFETSEADMQKLNHADKYFQEKSFMLIYDILKVCKLLILRKQNNVLTPQVIILQLRVQALKHLQSQAAKLATLGLLWWAFQDSGLRILLDISTNLRRLSPTLLNLYHSIV